MVKLSESELELLMLIDEGKAHGVEYARVKVLIEAGMLEVWKHNAYFLTYNGKRAIGRCAEIKRARAHVITALRGHGVIYVVCVSGVDKLKTRDLDRAIAKAADINCGYVN